MNQVQSYGVCKFCGANNVKSPKTGKIFCSDKCWLKKPNDIGAYPPNKLEAIVTSNQPNWDKIRKESHENMELLNAKNNATLLLVEAMRGGMTLVDALTNFDATTQEIYNVGRDAKV